MSEQDGKQAAPLQRPTTAHGLRNEITTLQEAAEAAGLFTALTWWQ